MRCCLQSATSPNQLQVREIPRLIRGRVPKNRVGLCIFVMTANDLGFRVKV